MQVINLPSDLKLKSQSSFKVFDYKTSKSCLKQMVALEQNTFSFLMEGRKEVFADNTSIFIQKSNFLLMKTGNCLMTETLPETKENYRSILFFFSNEVVLDFIQKHNINLKKNIEKRSIYDFQYDSFLKTFVQGLIHVNTLEINVREKLLAVKFEELMLYLLDLEGVDFLISLVLDRDNKTQHFIKTVELNKLNKLTLKELAFLSNMSVSTFKREFEKHFKASPSKWFQDKRLEHAAFLLKSQHKRPSDIFEESGYESLSNFIHAFKTKFGVTPKQYQLH